jgi:hypothetical protein
VSFTCPLVVSGANHDAFGRHHNGADHRVWTRSSTSEFGQSQRLNHERLVLRTLNAIKRRNSFTTRLDW